MDWKKIPLEQFRIGLGVEMEHADVTGGDPLKTGKIVLAHLKEDREYYSKLKRAGLERGREEKGVTFASEKDSEEECHVCQPFTKLVRDEKEFANCMKMASEIGELSNSKALVELIRGHMAQQDQEIFVAVMLDFRGQLRDFVEINRGQRHRVASDVEDIVRPVLLSGADGAAFAHCHPSGVAEPSDADRDLTIAIKKSMEIACPNIKFLDHLVVTPTESYSFADNGWGADGKVVKS